MPQWRKIKSAKIKQTVLASHTWRLWGFDGGVVSQTANVDLSFLYGRARAEDLAAQGDKAHHTTASAGVCFVLSPSVLPPALAHPRSEGWHQEGGIRVAFSRTSVSNLRFV